MLTDVLRNSDRPTRLLAACAGLIFVAGIVVVGNAYPAPVLLSLFLVTAAIVLVRYPFAAAVVALAVIPFHTALLDAVNRSGRMIGSFDKWKDALIVALFVRVIVGRFIAERRLRLSIPDSILLVYVVAYCGLALHSPNLSAGIRGLARDVEGPLLFLAIVLLRPTRRQAWIAIGAIVTAGLIVGGAAIIERLGPRERFLTWYGAKRPVPGGQFYVGANGYRPGSFMDSPLTLAFYCAGIAPFTFALATIRGRWRPAVVVSFIAVLTALVMTITRSAYIGGGVALIVVILLATHNPRIRLSLIGATLLLTGGMAFAYRGSEALVRSSETPAHRSALQKDFKQLGNHPLGLGLGTTDELQRRFVVTGATGTTESTFMAKALEGGIEGFLLWIIVLGVTLFRLRRERLRAIAAGDLTAAAVLAGAFAALIGIVLSGLFLGLQELTIEVALWGTAGAAMALASARLQETEEQEL